MSLARAVEDDNLEICRQIVENADDKNPARLKYHTVKAHDSNSLTFVDTGIPCPTDTHTPLHDAAKNGQLEICRLIIENIEEKNPHDACGNTPLLCAVMEGHLEVCRLIIDHVEDKNPKRFCQHGFCCAGVPFS